MTFVPETVGTITTAFGPKNYGNLQEVASGSLVAGTWWDGGDLSQTLTSASLVKRHAHPAKGSMPVVVQPDTYAVTTSQTGANGSNVSYDISPTLDQATPPAVGPIAFDAPLAVHQNQRGEVRMSPVAWGLNQGGGKPGQGNPVIAFTAKDAGVDAGVVSPTLRGGNHVDGNANGGVPPAVAFDAWDYRDSVPGEVADPLRGGGRVAVASETVVRRLTPLECERLQGLPDGHTAVPFRGRAVAADGNRYRAIGNGWAVPVVRWLFARLDRVHVGCQADG